MTLPFPTSISIELGKELQGKNDRQSRKLDIQTSLVNLYRGMAQIHAFLEREENAIGFLLLPQEPMEAGSVIEELDRDN